MNRIHHTRLVRRAAAIVAGLVGAALAVLTTAPVALASKTPGPFGPAGTAPQHRVHTAVAGGMPGWQIMLLVAGAVAVGAALAVLVARLRAAQRQVTAAAT